MPTFDTERKGCVADAGGSGFFNPLTLPFNSAMFTRVRFRVWVQGFKANTTVVPAVQFSDDGVNWSATPSNFGYTPVTATDGWKFSSFDDWKNVFVDAASRKPYCRFGVLLDGDSTEGVCSIGQVQLAIEYDPVPATTLNAENVIVNSDKSVVDSFQAVTEWVSVTSGEYARFTFEITSTTGFVEIAPAYQVADQPMVASDLDWRLVPSLTARSTVGTTYGTDFATWYSVGNAADAKKRFIRFGFGTNNTSGSEIKAVLASLRVDLRDRAT